jgi:FtsZ-binding cell division protein ZapB
MAETKTDWMPTGLERFGHLEDKIVRVVEAFKTVQTENEILKAEIHQLKLEVQNLQEGDSTARENLALMHKEREELRERVEKALGMLATLEVK